MKTIYKYSLPITDKSKIIMPVGAKILCVKAKKDAAYIWAEVNNEEQEEVRTFRVFGTGHKISDDKKLEYIGTVFMFNDVLVFHIYEIKNEI